MTVKGTKTINYEFESNKIIVKHTTGLLSNVYLFERNESGNSFAFRVDKLGSVIEALLALDNELAADAEEAGSNDP